jgi:chromosome segregation ATPase
LQATLRNDKLQIDLAFYQQQAADAMQHRDQANSDADHWREQHAHVEGQLSQRMQALQAERSTSSQQKQRVQQLQAEVARLQAQADIAAGMPALQRELDRRQDNLCASAARCDDLQVRVPEHMNIACL